MMINDDKIELIGGAAFAALLFVIACIAFGVFGIIRAAVIILTLFAVGAMPARADDSWINWGGYKSPIDGTHCCGANDCFLIPASEVKVTTSGYLLSNGETVPYMEAQPSEDQQYWRCKRHDGSRRCFFAPQPGS